MPCWRGFGGVACCEGTTDRRSIPHRDRDWVLAPQDGDADFRASGWEVEAEISSLSMTNALNPRTRMLRGLAELRTTPDDSASLPIGRRGRGRDQPAAHGIVLRRGRCAKSADSRRNGQMPGHPLRSKTGSLGHTFMKHGEDICGMPICMAGRWSTQLRFDPLPRVSPCDTLPESDPTCILAIPSDRDWCDWPMERQCELPANVARRGRLPPLWRHPQACSKDYLLGAPRHFRRGKSPVAVEAPRHNPG
jgi:hypothetical protein